MPKDLVQESSGDFSLAARADDGLLGLVEVPAQRGNGRAQGNRFDALLNLYSNYIEDGYDDWEGNKPGASCQLTDEQENLILERAVTSLCIGPVADKRSIWRSFRGSVRSLFGA